MTDTRDLFERTFALCDRQKWQHKDGSYKDASIQGRWEGWQAREKIAAPNDQAIIDAADATSKGSNTAPDLPPEEMKWLFGLADLRAFLAIATPAPTAPSDAQAERQLLDRVDQAETMGKVLQSAIRDKDKRIAELEAQLLAANQREAKDYSELLDEMNRVKALNATLFNQIVAAAPVEPCSNHLGCIHPSKCPTIGKCNRQGTAQLAAPAPTALERFNARKCDELDNETPLERLRYFCSLSMPGKDWLDAEQFFDALGTQLATPAPTAPSDDKDKRIAELQAKLRKACDDRAELQSYLDMVTPCDAPAPTAPSDAEPVQQDICNACETAYACMHGCYCRLNKKNMRDLLANSR